MLVVIITNYTYFQPVLSTVKLEISQLAWIK